MYNEETTEVYCDVADYAEIGAGNPPKNCLENADLATFTLNESNYQDYTKYRFVFNKADDGTYYFSKVEKL